MEEEGDDICCDVYMPQCHTFVELDDSLFFDSLPPAEQVMEGAVPASDAEVMEMVEMLTEKEDLPPMQKGSMEMESPPKEVMEMKQSKGTPKMETDVEKEMMPELETAETKRANERMAEIEVPKEMPEKEVAKDTLETEAVNIALQTRGAKDIQETLPVKEPLHAEVVKEVSMMELPPKMMEAPQLASRGKNKRCRPTSWVQSRPPKKREEEDVCFICFDGGSLVLCDRRGCPKAYHPSCIHRDEAFFRTKGRWNCGWHICSLCQKASQYMCYTCTYSLCKRCIKEAGFLCIRGDKGLCGTCMKTVLLIEQTVPANKETAVVDFDDKSNWEYLFKHYWLDLKRKLSITSEELARAKIPLKGSGVSAHNGESSYEIYDAKHFIGASCSK